MDAPIQCLAQTSAHVDTVIDEYEGPAQVHRQRRVVEYVPVRCQLAQGHAGPHRVEHDGGTFIWGE